MVNGSDQCNCLTCEHGVAVKIFNVPNGYYRCPFKKQWQLTLGTSICNTGKHSQKKAAEAPTTDQERAQW